MDNDKMQNESIQKFSETLKKLSTPKGLRESNRKCIKEALYSTNQQIKMTVGWFRKRISIPLPVAAGFLLILCLQIALGFRNLTTHTRETKTITGKAQINQIDEPKQQVKSYYSEQAVYVAGIGLVEKTKNYESF